MNLKQLQAILDQTKFVNDDQFDKINMAWLKIRLTHSTKLQVLQKISSKLESGGSLFSEIANLTEIYERQVPKSVAAKFLRIIYERYSEVNTLSYALAPFFPKQILTIIISGEVSGNLAQSINLAADIMQKRAKMKAAAKLGFIIPIVAYIMVVGTAAFTHFKLFAQIISSLPAEKLSNSFLIISNIAAFIVQTSWFTGLMVFIYVIYSIWSVPRQINKRPKSLPPWSTTDSANSAIVLKVFASLLRSGSSAAAALSTIADHSDPYVAHWCRDILGRMVKGKDLGPAFACDFFQKEPRIEIESYAGSKDFEAKLDLIAESVFDATTRLINKVTMFTVGLCMFIVTGTSSLVAFAVISLDVTSGM